MSHNDVVPLETGWHITSLECWQGIQETGWLEPYSVANHHDIVRFCSVDKAIWIWPERPAGESLVGTVIDRIIQKLTRKIVMLALYYTMDDVVCPRYFYTHQGSIDHPRALRPWIYHEEEKFLLLCHAVPLERVRPVFFYRLR